MVWGKKRNGVDDLVAKVRSNGTGDSLLIMSMRTFGAVEAEQLCDALGDNQSLKQLLCSGHVIGTRGAVAFGEALQRNQHLEHLALGSSKFGCEGVKALLHGWDNSTLLVLDLEYKDLKDASTESLRVMLEHEVTGIQELRLGRNSIGSEGVANLCLGMQRNTSLRHLDLQANAFGPEAMEVLSQALSLSRGLVTLRLSSNPSVGRGLNLMTSFGQLKEIHLDKCEISSQQLDSVHTCFSDSCVQVLSLSENKLDEASGKYLKDIVEHAPCLKRLELQRNNLGAKGVETLAKYLADRDVDCQLEFLDIGQNSIDDSELSQQVMMWLLEAQTLRELRTLGNPLKDNIAHMMCEYLREDKTLKVLSLGGIGLTEQGCENIMNILVDVPCLEVLELGGNNIGERGHNAVDKLMELNPKLDIAVDKGLQGDNDEDLPLRETPVP